MEGKGRSLIVCDEEEKEEEEEEGRRKEAGRSFFLTFFEGIGIKVG